MPKGMPSEDAMYVASVVCTRVKDEGYNLAHDGDFVRPIARELLQKANKGQVITLWYRMVTPESVILERIKRRKPTAGMPTVAQALQTYKKRKKLHDTIKDINDLPYLYLFDASRDDLDAQVDIFVQKARKMLA